MKTYIKPTIDIVELSVKENIAANEYVVDTLAGITTYSVGASLLGSEGSTPIGG